MIPVRLLCTRIIAAGSAGLLAQLGTPCPVLGLLSTDCDDATYIALDEATKAANVEVVYARSLYAGAANATTRLAGEVIGILGGQTPEEVRTGLEAARNMLARVGFEAADTQGSVVYLAHTIPRSGSFLSRQAGVAPGSPLAYLIAPPTEAICGLDAALKAAAVELKTFFAPPSETNFAGGLLTGTESACAAAAEAFAAAVCHVAQHPQDTGGNYGT